MAHSVDSEMNVRTGKEGRGRSSPLLIIRAASHGTAPSLPYARVAATTRAFFIRPYGIGTNYCRGHSPVSYDHFKISLSVNNAVSERKTRAPMTTTISLVANLCALTGGSLWIGRTAITNRRAIWRTLGMVVGGLLLTFTGICFGILLFCELSRLPDRIATPMF
jgi:hypothetical protein